MYKCRRARACTLEYMYRYASGMVACRMLYVCHVMSHDPHDATMQPVPGCTRAPLEYSNTVHGVPLAYRYR